MKLEAQQHVAGVPPAVLRILASMFFKEACHSWANRLKSATRQNRETKQQFPKTARSLSGTFKWTLASHELASAAHALLSSGLKSAFQKNKKKIVICSQRATSGAQHSGNLQGDVAAAPTNLFLIPFIDLLGFKHLRVTKLISPNRLINAF